MLKYSIYRVAFLSVLYFTGSDIFASDVVVFPVFFTDTSSPSARTVSVQKCSKFHSVSRCNPRSSGRYFLHRAHLHEPNRNQPSDHRMVTNSRKNIGAHPQSSSTRCSQSSKGELSAEKVKSPITGRLINIGGPAFQKVPNLTSPPASAPSIPRRTKKWICSFRASPTGRRARLRPQRRPAHPP